ncbi:DUF2200 domain-containing protein [Microbacterium laevaniformans]|uniref:DUF2200 domain-containing protein n=1 Tax=Microbacterium laevaniformans TaxID=36807 RepID=UPI001956C5FD|nr:DUF2200 domain-containing protein [Microbacterium laevaniformans]MBM7752853.1 hypothetical protein [Microbacterium laevaniformans]GLJ64096.1 hypothetical protein GCM10017578_09840 [Microbacterium laevaniformans]
MERIFDMPVARVYPLYVQKVQRKGRSADDVEAVTRWLTGYSAQELADHFAAQTNFRDFFAGARLHPGAAQITGVICGVRVEQIADPLMQKIRYLDKLVDEVARGRPLEKILRA